MTEQKATNYKISKRLSELGFDSESHCGWWLEKIFIETKDEDSHQWTPHRDEDTDEKMDVDDYKAYDCWDLIDYAFKKEENTSLFSFLEDAANIMLEVCDDPEDANPANALGKAVIKILEEDSNG